MGKKKKTLMLFEEQDEWLSDMQDDLGVDQSFLVRRAIKYYRDRGITKDKILREHTDEEIKP
jgi:hypothetical protein